MSTLPPHVRSPEGYAAIQAAYRSALSRLTVPSESLTVQTRFGDTHILAAGPPDGPPAVLLHGWNAHAPGWWPQINALASRHRLFAPDTIGQAGRSAPTRPSTRGPAYGQWCLDVLDRLGLEHADLVGSSGGAWLILKLAELSPARIQRAALLSPAGIVPVRWGFALHALAVGWLSPRADTPRRLARLFTPAPLPLDEEHAEVNAALLVHLRNQPPPPTLPDRTLRQLSAPTLLLLGEHEVVFSRRRMIARARRRLPNLPAIEVIAGAGHDLTYDRPEVVNAHLARFLETASP